MIRDLWILWRASRCAERKGLVQKYGTTSIWGIAAGACALLATVFGALEGGQPIAWKELLPEALAIVGAVIALIRLRVAVAKSSPHPPA